MPAADWSHHVYSFSHLSSVTGWKIINKNHLNTKKSRQMTQRLGCPAPRLMTWVQVPGHMVEGEDRLQQVVL